MKPDRYCISYLASTQFLRNPSLTLFVQSEDCILKQNNVIWYCVGIIDNLRYVHAVEFLQKTPKPGITSYYIRWYKTAPYSQLSVYDMPQRFDYIEFWVHSGVALRKNIFLYEDRMSLIRSTFCYDSKTKQYYRMSSLLNYINIPEKVPQNVPIYSSPIKKYYFSKKVKKTTQAFKQSQKNIFRKNLQKFCECQNSTRFIELEYPKLFQEMQVIISGNGNTP